METYLARNSSFYLWFKTKTSLDSNYHRDKILTILSMHVICRLHVLPTSQLLRLCSQADYWRYLFTLVEESVSFLVVMTRTIKVTLPPLNSFLRVQVFFMNFCVKQLANALLWPHIFIYLFLSNFCFLF